MTTGTVTVAPSTALPKSRSSGATLKPVLVIVEPVDVPVDGAVGVGLGLSVGDADGLSVGTAVAWLGAGVWQRGRVSPATHGRAVGRGVLVGCALGSRLGMDGASEGAIVAGLIPKHPIKLRRQTGMRATTRLRDRREPERRTADSLPCCSRMARPAGLEPTTFRSAT
jgi:hypothetical protein